MGVCVCACVYMKATTCRQIRTSGNSHNEESMNIHLPISIFQNSISLLNVAMMVE